MKPKFGDLLRDARRKLDLTLQDVADRLDVSVVYVSEVERGKRPPFTRDRLAALAELVKIPEETLFAAAAFERKSVDFNPNECSPKQLEALTALARGGLSDEKLDRILELIRKKENKKSGRA